MHAILPDILHFQFLEYIHTKTEFPLGKKERKNSRDVHRWNKLRRKKKYSEKDKKKAEKKPDEKKKPEPKPAPEKKPSADGQMSLMDFGMAKAG